MIEELRILITLGDKADTLVVGNVRQGVLESISQSSRAYARGIMCYNDKALLCRSYFSK